MVRQPARCATATIYSGGRFVTSNQILFARHLGYLPIQTPLAAKITAGSGHRIGAGAGMEMEQRLFLDGIYMLADRASVY